MLYQHGRDWLCWDCHPKRAEIAALPPRVCGRCNGSGVALDQPCACKLRRIFRSRLLAIPPRYRFRRLDRLVPDRRRHPKQAKAIEVIRKNRNRSFLLTGLNGSGKTLFGWCLYKEGLRAGRRVFGSTVRELLEAYRREAIEGVTPPLSPRDMKTGKWTVFIDEFEKARPTEFGCESLFGLVDAIYQHRHQIVVASNLTPEQLMDHWGRIEPVWGSSILRRLEESMQIEMF